MLRAKTADGCGKLTISGGLCPIRGIHRTALKANDEGMKHLLFASFRSASALVGFGLVFSSVGLSQSSASLSGRAINETGQPITNPVVRLLSDTTLQSSAHARRYTLIGDSLGKFSQEGIAPGAYLVMLFTDGKAANILQSVSLKAGDSIELDFDMGAQQPVRLVTSDAVSLMAVRGKASGRTK